MEHVQDEIKEAARYFKISSDKGKKESKCIYASLLRAGKGVSVNKEAADENDINSMYNYAVMLKNG